jgi:hypothetical protein
MGVAFEAMEGKQYDVGSRMREGQKRIVLDRKKTD